MFFLGCELLFWAALGVVLYTYLGFPLLLSIRGLFNRKVDKGEGTPALSMVIIAHNEENVIAEKLENVLSLDYPQHLLQVLVGSDGSDDATNEIVRRFEDRGVQLIACQRQGKIGTLNETVRHATGEILVFSDANSILADGTLRALASCFADPTVGAVAGDQRYTKDYGNAAGLGERIFWNVDRFLKQMQTRGGNATSSTGAIHAVRSSLFSELPPGMSDDFIISTRAIAAGYRLVFEANAIAFEEVTPSDRREFKRKTRVIARGIRGMWHMRRLLNPFSFGFYSFQLFSHKVLRWSIIFILPLILATNALLLSHGTIYQMMFVLQLGFYGTALLAALLRNTKILRHRIVKLAAIPYFFCLANMAAWYGWCEFFAGRKVDIWSSQRTSDSGETRSVAGNSVRGQSPQA